jgi:hypothetical protein
MNSDTPLPAEQNKTKTHADDDADHIPVLDEVLEHPTALGGYGAAPSAKDDLLEFAGSESQALELNVDLGYAEATAEYSEADDLADMEEIYTLPLAEMVLDDSQDLLVSTEQNQQIATLEAIVFDSENPNVPAPRKADPASEILNPHAGPELTAASEDEPLLNTPESLTLATPLPVSPPLTKPLPKTSDNPFLPQHILDRLNQGKRNLVEEIAQSSAALDASTAILRTHARAERLAKPTYSEARPQQAFSRDKSTQQKQKLVDELVEEYLPLIAAEMRRRLRKLLDEE